MKPLPRFFSYGMEQRPFSELPLELKKQAIGTESHPDYPQFGVVHFSKPIPFNDEEHLSLVPLDPEHPKNLAKARQQFHTELMDQVSDKGAATFQLKNGGFLILSENAGSDKEKHPWRITRFLKDSTPAGHETFADFAAASNHLHAFKSDFAMEQR